MAEAKHQGPETEFDCCYCCSVAVCVCLQYDKIIAEIEQIGGVVTHGLLQNVADAIVIADQKEGVTVVECEKQQQAAAAAS